MDEPSAKKFKLKPVFWAMAAVAAWGSMIALGVFLPADGDWSKWSRWDGYGALIVLACTGTLLGVWGLFLWARSARERAKNSQQ